MAKFIMFYEKIEKNMIEIEANTANEAEDIFWNTDEEGKTLDYECNFQEVYVGKERVRDWNKKY